MKRIVLASVITASIATATAIAWSSWGHRRAADEAAEAENALAISSQAVQQVRDQQSHPRPDNPAVVASKRADRMVAESEGRGAPRDP